MVQGPSFLFAPAITLIASLIVFAPPATARGAAGGGGHSAPAAASRGYGAPGVGASTAARLQASRAIFRAQHYTAMNRLPGRPTPRQGLPYNQAYRPGLIVPADIGVNSRPLLVGQRPYDTGSSYGRGRYGDRNGGLGSDGYAFGNYGSYSGGGSYGGADGLAAYGSYQTFGGVQPYGSGIVSDAGGGPEILPYAPPRLIRIDKAGGYRTQPTHRSHARYDGAETAGRYSARSNDGIAPVVTYGDAPRVSVGYDPNFRAYNNGRNPLAAETIHVRVAR